jgi:hypothetical protein
MGALALGVGLRTRTVFPIIWGSMFGGIPFLMALVPFFNVSRTVLVVAAIAVFVFGWVKGGTERWRNITRGSGSGRRGGDSAGSHASSADDSWVMGAAGSSSGSGSSSSSSGSFGGGSSGGGGASGSW